MSTSYVKMDRQLVRAVAPADLLKSVLAALNQKDICQAVDQFADEFIFHDHALDLEFTNKARLEEFFQKSRELFPDTALEVVATFERGDFAVAEWELTATQTQPFGSISYRFPIRLRGVTIAQIKNGRVAHWSDYYDQLTSRRGNLGAFFAEWIEY